MTGRNTAIRDRHRKHLARGKPPCAYTNCLYPDVPIDYDADHLDPLAYVVDHIVPLIRGGTDTLDNKQPMHRACNRDKSDKLETDHETPLTRHFETHRNWTTPTSRP